MKKVITILLCSVVALGTLTACSNNEKPTASTTPTATATVQPTANMAKTGLAIISSVAKSTAAGAEDGMAQADSLAVAVLVGEDGKILACRIDSAQTQIKFSAEGKITTDREADIKSKQELGDEYGMKKASEIGKEWYEQADAFAAYVVGKTVEGVKGISVDSEGYPTDADLTSSVTIHVTDFMAAVEKAVTNAKNLGASSTDKLGLAISTEIANSTDASAEKAGLAEAYSTYSVATTDATGKITSCYIDASMSDVNFDTKGVITSDIKAAPATKQELG